MALSYWMSLLLFISLLPAGVPAAIVSNKLQKVLLI